MPSNNLDIENSLEKLENWIDGNGFKGWDPYDLKGTSLYLFFLSKNTFFLKTMQLLCYYVFDVFFPNFSRKLLAVDKKINAKGIGLLMKGHLVRYTTTNDNKYLNKAIICSEWLVQNSSKDYEGISWGYPFDWASKIFIPKGTPSSVVSCIVGDSFWDMYQITKDIKYLEVCKGICYFLFTELKITFKDDTSCCHSYTPIDDFQVHNANLFVSEFLLRVGKETQDEAYIQRAISSANFALKYQLDNGSIEYWAQSHNSYKSGQMDIYHSGYEIRALYKIWKLTDLPEFEESYKRYYTFFINSYFTEKNEIKLKPTEQYPIDIHGCAEAIIMLTVLKRSESLVDEVVEWTIRNMQKNRSWFLYRKVKLPLGIKKDINIPYLRWGQGWMYIALATYIKQKQVAMQHKHGDRYD